ncbi:UNVERIFIED_CONTAM: Retrovirus-related Pol polyprotein from transposon RE1 [Sesamum radiatum]|uniref:Retrovirus-related Pol polyprotein from transposon RE1 n=1 Tax=Sesamum radiatum TaxID=300843 RepID=A0AAW2LKE2_SESRA
MAGTSATTTTVETRDATFPDRLQLHGSDHPGMVLILMIRILQWIRVDSMVTTWILNSISKDIVEAFMYAKSSRTLWLDLEQRYGECNGPQLYQLQREICSMTQGNSSLSSYFTNMKKLWDEMAELKPTRQCTCGCTCGAWADVANSAAFTQLMQFLMGLSDVFDTVKHQLLVMAPVPSPPDSRVCLRRSQRVSSKPSWLSDYDCHCISSATSCSPISYSTAHIQFVAHLSTLQEPKSYLQASKDRNWVEAMIQELNALAANKTWTLTSLPPGKRTIGSRWVYKLKLKPDGSIDRYKARLVAKGYNQIEGVDYFDSFSPVAKSVTVRIFLSLAASKSWPLLQLDVNNAFLHGSLDEDVYMVPPDGLLGVESGQVCKLQKSLYGLKQASRQWNLELTTKLLDFGFKQSTHEHCLFIKQSATEFTALLVYVDDILLTGSSEAALHSVRDYLDRLFTIKDLGSAKYFLGLELARSSHGLHVTQRKYLHDILADASMLDAKPAPTPFPSGLKLVLADGSLLPDPNRYRRLVGRLLYLGFTRPDISFAVQQLSQFLQAPRSSHWDAAIHVLRYLKGTPSTSLFFSSSSSVQLSAFSDASWASCLDSRRSITGYCVFLGSSLISWKTKKQATVSRSSAEAEYRSMASTVCELLWISFVLRDLGVPVSLPIPFWCDNRAALHITANPVFHERTKHLDIDCHLVRNQFKLGFIAPSHIPGSDQVADLFTKSLPTADFVRFLSKMGLSSSAPS